MNLQKNHESTKEHNSKSQKLKFVMIFVPRCQYKFSNIGSTMHRCQMSKADAGHVDFLIRTIIKNGLYLFSFKQLAKLFDLLRCFDCGSTFKLQKTCFRGSMLLATFLCENNHSPTWKSQSTENLSFQWK
jgi:hypothetical protein